MPMNQNFEAFSRRDLLRITAGSLAGIGSSSWLPRLAAATGGKRPPRACILLWMGGGPSQWETLDPKPGHANGGPTKAIATAADGVQISDNLPLLAAQMRDVAVIRSMQTREGDHGRATQLMTTGYRPMGGAVDYPVLGSLVAHRLTPPGAMLPGFVSIGGGRQMTRASGFLGAQYSPLLVSGASSDPTARANLSIENLDAKGSAGSLAQRQQLLDLMRNGLPAKSEAAAKHAAIYEQAMRMVETRGGGAFDLEDEPASLRDEYGRNRFGQGCLLARRLVERGVPFVEVTLDVAGDASWDSHLENFRAVSTMCQTLDPAWATLLKDLRQRGMLESTMVVWMGEFGRTPKINPNRGRDHFPDAWSVAAAGGRIVGGQVVGATTADGMQIAQRPVSASDLFATLLEAIGISSSSTNDMGDRPINIVDGGSPIQELLA